MGNKYNGTYKKTTNTDNFDWGALISWLTSLVISFIPLYIELIKYLDQKGFVDFNFFTKAFIEGDVLWIFSTVLLFVLVDAIIKKRYNGKIWIKIFLIIGVLIFVIAEATWIAFLFIDIPDDAIWPLFFLIPISIFSIVISTPLKIEFIKED